MNQIERLLHSLNAADVRYVMIGAAAFAAHGWVRATLDTDLYVAGDRENIERLRRVLVEFGYDISGASVEDFQKFKILLRQYDLPLDIHPFIKGAAPFPEVWARRVDADLGSVTAHFASLEDLIEMDGARPALVDLLGEGAVDCV